MNHKTLYAYNKTYGDIGCINRTYFSKLNSFTFTLAKAFTCGHGNVNEIFLHIPM